MKSNFLKTTTVVAIIYSIAYLLSLYYRASPNEVERYHLLLILFVTLGIGGIYIQEHFFILLLLLLPPLIIGISFYGWYTFENEKEWTLTQYFFNWCFPVILTYLLKGYRWLRFSYGKIKLKN